MCLCTGFGFASLILAELRGACVWAFVLPVPRKSWLGCWGVCICARVLPVPRHSWLGFVVRVFGHGFRLYSANPGWRVFCIGVGFGFTPPIQAWVLRCVCLCACSACTPPVLAEVWGVGVSAWVRVSAAPYRSCLGCWGVCVCVRAPPLPRHSWMGFVLLVSGFGFGLSPRHSLLGCWGVCVCVRSLLVPRQSWLGCAVRLCVLRFGFRQRPTIPGWDVGCVRLCSLVLYPANPCWGVRACVFVCALCLYPANPGFGVQSGSVCLDSGLGCAPPFMSGV